MLTLFGITLGVATILAVSVVNASVLASFRKTIERIAGKTALTVGAKSGVPEELLERVRKVEGIAAAVPVIEDVVHDVEGNAELAVLGIDALADSEVRDYEMSGKDVKIEDDLAFLNDPRGILVTERFAARRGLSADDTLELKTVTGVAEFTVRGTLAPRGPATAFGGDFLLMDVFAAQIAFARGRRFDRIDIVPKEGVALPALEARLKDVVGMQIDIARPERRSQEAEQLMAGFQLGLSLAGLVAIFVGGFIVYNALSIAVAQRRREIGILRALSCTRSQVLALFVAEGLALGIVGAVLGVVGGLFLAQASLGLVGDTVSASYVSVKPEELQITALDLVVAIALGVAVSFVAALWPAWRASFVEPASSMRRQLAGSGAGAGARRGPLAISVGFALVSLVLAGVAHARGEYLLGYGVAGILNLSAAFLAPSLGATIGRFFTSFARAFRALRSPVVLLGITGFLRNSERNAVAVAALGIALGNVVNTDAFVTSMRKSTERWFERSARADILAFAGRKGQGKMIDRPLPAALIEEIRTLPEVEFVNPYRTVRYSQNEQPYHINAFDLEGYSKYNSLPVVEGDEEEAIVAIAAGRGVAASESFAHNFNVGVGDTLSLETPSGVREFSVELIYVDYASELGSVLTTRDVYSRLWKDDLANTLGIYLRPGADAVAVREMVVERWGGKYGMLALSNRQYKSEAGQSIEGSFAFMRVTELIAIIVAILGIVNTLLVTVIDRRTEIGVLKAIGADPAQVRSMLTIEGSLIALTAAVFGVGLGAILSGYIVTEVLPMQVGWRMNWRLSAMTVLSTFLIAQAVAFVASFWPAQAASRINPVQALQYE
ncbi:MAG: FtsX-like permease family protein [Myxococcales bacterium]|nr:FtsX-like permease family protein [Myxococcales bacterium]